MRHLLTLQDWTPEELLEVLNLAIRVKKNPEYYRDAMAHKTLWMLFEKPSLRTRVSFETGVTQMGGHAIYYDMSTSPLGSGKETIADTARTVSRYVDVVMARLYEHDDLEELARYASVPVINALTNFSHPCQIMADLLTVLEHKGELKGRTLSYVGDSHNNVTHSLLFGCAMAGVHIRVGCPDDEQYAPQAHVLEQARAIGAKTGAEIGVFADAGEAVDGADAVYTDSWMSYHIKEEEKQARIAVFTPYQVNEALMKQAKPDAIFMNCLPAARGFEQSAEVIDGPQSVVFDQAENRLHAQKAIMLSLMAD